MAEIPSVPEQDRGGGDNLPTYEDLAAQNGPNSRYTPVTYFYVVTCQAHFIGSDSADGRAG